MRCLSGLIAKLTAWGPAAGLVTLPPAAGPPAAGPPAAGPPAAALIALPLAAALIALSPAAASAQEKTYYHVGDWDAFSGRNSGGGAVCGMGNTNPSDGRRLSLRFHIGGNDMMFAVSKPDWSIPDATRVSVVMQVGLNSPWTPAATGSGQTISWTLDQIALPTFDRQFRSAASMTITFPDGNEKPWTLSLAGSTAISNTFSRCVSDLTRQVQAVQPPTSVGPASPGITQPFGRPAAR